MYADTYACIEFACVVVLSTKNWCMIKGYPLINGDVMCFIFNLFATIDNSAFDSIVFVFLLITQLRIRSIVLEVYTHTHAHTCTHTPMCLAKTKLYNESTIGSTK